MELNTNQITLEDWEVKKAKTLVSGSNENSIRVWSIKNGDCIKVLEGHTKSVTSLVSNSNGMFFSSSLDGKIGCWDKENLSLSGHLNENSVEANNSKEKISALEMITPKLLASANEKIKIWDIENGKCIKTFSGHISDTKMMHYFIKTLKRLSDYELASGSFDRTIKIWHFDSDECIKTLQSHSDAINALELITENILASGSDDKKIKIWNYKTGELIHTLQDHTEPVCSLRCVSDDMLISGSCEIKIWNLKERKCIRTITEHKSSIMNIVSISDSIFATGSNDGYIKIWNSTTGCIQSSFQTNTKIKCLALI